MDPIQTQHHQRACGTFKVCTISRHSQSGTQQVYGAAQHEMINFKAENSTLDFITLEAKQSFKTLWIKDESGDVCSLKSFEKEVAACERQRPASQEEKDDMMQQLQERATGSPPPRLRPLRR